MGLKKLAAKVADYRERYDQGKASKIEPDHVRKTLKKLCKREAELVQELTDASKAEDKDRLKRKLDIAREHISRAEWLLKELAEPEPDVNADPSKE